MSSLKDTIPAEEKLSSNHTFSLETLQLLAQLVEQTSDVLTAADIDYKPVTWNKAAENVYGLKAEEVIGKNIRDFLVIHYQGFSRDQIREIIHQEGEWRGEAFFVRPTDKKTVTIWMCFKQMKGADANVAGYLISATDITERKESESLLKESEERFREMADSSPAMIWMCDENNRVTYNNKKWIEFTGEDVTGFDDGWEKLLHKEDERKVTAEYYKAFEERRQITLVYRLKKTDGSYHWVHDVSVPRFLSSGKFIGYIGTVVDIENERKKQEQLLYQATILGNVSDIIVTTDLEFKVKSWNKTAEYYYGITEANAIGKQMHHLVDFTFYGTNVEKSLEDLKSNGIWTGEVSIKKEDKTFYFLETVKYVQDENENRIGFLAMGKDITEIKLVGEKLKQSENFYRTLIGDSLDGILLMDEKGIIQFSSPSVKNVLGYEAEELIGRTGFEFVHQDDITWAVQSFQKEVTDNPEIKFITVRLLKKDGQWLWCNVRGHSLLDNPSIHNIVIYFHDDTLRKQAKEALQESEKRFRTLIRDLQVGVFLSDNKGKVLMCNQALAKMLAISEENIIGYNIYRLLSSDIINEQNEFIPIKRRPLAQAIQFKQTVKNSVIGIWNPLLNERLWVMVNVDPILDVNGNMKHVVCSVMDITERKKLEKKLVTEQVAHQKQLTQATIDGQEKERLEIGKELHDNIGQQLTTIQLFLDYAKTSANATSLEMINRALKSVSDVINEVRAMSRSLVPYTLKDLGLIDSVNDLIESFERTQAIEIEFEHSLFLEETIAENQKLALFRIIQEQLNNIVKHASAKKVSIRLLTKASEIFLEVKDNGNGIDRTKTKKGLGFINIRNRAELFNGKAELYSNPGQGCLLSVSFPQTLKNAVEVLNSCN